MCKIMKKSEFKINEREPVGHYNIVCDVEKLYEEYACSNCSGTFIYKVSSEHKYVKSMIEKFKFCPNCGEKITADGLLGDLEKNERPKYESDRVSSDKHILSVLEKSSDLIIYQNSTDEDDYCLVGQQGFDNYEYVVTHGTWSDLEIIFKRFKLYEESFDYESLDDIDIIISDICDDSFEFCEFEEK